MKDENGKPRETDEGEMNFMERMKRSLKRLKVDKSREEPFGKETQTHYTRTDDGRSRYDTWRKKRKASGFKRSESNPQYFRTASKKRWVHDNYRYGR